MKILFTGASSLTGMWFIKELADAGHLVTACFRGSLESYSGLRRQRVDSILPYCRPVFNCLFGSESFFDAIKLEPKWDLYCHHAADVTNYKDQSFDVVAAVANNTNHVKFVLTMLKERECQKILLTGSVFEQQEGAGSDDLRAVSPYGLSKGLTSDIFRFYVQQMEMKLGKFVITNPFGPYEEPRFTTYLIKTWYELKSAAVNTPYYVRDNVHVSLLAQAYRRFAHRLSTQPGFENYNPSGYVESQGAFTSRFANEMRMRLGLPCDFECKPQLEFVEPKVRINTEPLNSEHIEWDESKAWDELANYYKNTYGNK